MHSQGQEALSQRCMLPLIDLCNHAGTASNCCLSMRLSSCGQPRWLPLDGSGSCVVMGFLTQGSPASLLTYTQGHTDSAEPVKVCKALSMPVSNYAFIRLHENC